MKTQIKTLEISNFKSIKRIKMDCKRINVFIGKPNVGKSNILEALSLFCAPFSDVAGPKFLSEFIRYEELHNLFYFQEVKEKVKISTDIGLAMLKYQQNQNRFELIMGGDAQIIKMLEINRTTSRNVSFTTDKRQGKAINAFYQDIMPDGKASYPSIERASIIKKYDFKSPQISNSSNAYFLSPPFGNNLFKIIETNKIVRDIANKFFKQFDLDFVNDIKNKQFIIQKKIAGDIYTIPYSLTADTLQRIIFHIAAIESNENSIILFEEPEAHSFPGYIDLIANKIITNKSNQFFIATHSPYLLSPFLEKCTEKEVAIFITKYENDQTIVKKMTKNEIQNVIDNEVDLFFNLKSFSE